MKQRIQWIDGIKGIACVMIFVHHFMLAFYPSTYFGNETVSHSFWDIYLSQSPYGVIINGNFYVCIFCILSGLLISLQVWNRQGDLQKISESMLKRYFRLAFPVAGVSFVVYVMLKLSVFSNLEVAKITGSTWLSSFYHEKYTIKDVFVHSFVKTWTESDGSFSTAFWMLTYIFYGSFLAYILAIIGYEKNKKIILLFMGVVAWYLWGNSLLACFGIGTIIGYYSKNCNRKRNSICGIIFIIIGVFFGGYPSHIIPINVYKLFYNMPGQMDPSHFYHVIGAAMVIVGIYECKEIAGFLENKLFLFLGKISFSLYLIHIPILFSVGTDAFLIFNRCFENYHVNVLLTFMLTFVILIILSLVFHVIVESKCEKIVKKIVYKVEE